MIFHHDTTGTFSLPKQLFVWSIYFIFNAEKGMSRIHCVFRRGMLHSWWHNAADSHVNTKRKSA